MALTLLQIATRILCAPTTSYVISSYSNVRLQQPSVEAAALTSVESQMVIDETPLMLDSMPLIDAESMTLPTTNVIDNEEMKIENFESSTVTIAIATNDDVKKEEEIKISVNEGIEMKDEEVTDAMVETTQSDKSDSEESKTESLFVTEQMPIEVTTML